MARIDRDKLGEQLSAYFDGELNDEDRAAVEAALRGDPSARAELARLRETGHAVGELPRHEAPGSLAADVMATIERGDLLGDAAPSSTKHGWSRRSLSALLATAAMITVAITVGLWGISQSETKRGVFVAALSADVDDLDREILRSDLRRDVAPLRKEALPESRPAEAVAPPVVAMAAPPARTEYHDAKVDEVAKVAPPRMKAKVFGPGSHDRSDLSAGARPDADVHLDVTCPNEGDLRWCSARVNEFMYPRQGQSRNENWRDAVTAPPYSAGVIAEDDGSVTVEYTLRIPSSRLRSLMDVFEAKDVQRRGVTLTIGTMVQARGWRESRQLSEMVLARATRGEPRPPTDQPYSQESRPRRSVPLGGRTKPTAERGRIGGTDEGGAKMTEDKKELDEWLELFGMRLPQPSESEEAAEASVVSMEQDQSSAARSTPEQLISVTVRFRAPADPPPSGPPGQLVPRRR